MTDITVGQDLPTEPTQAKIKIHIAKAKADIELDKEWFLNLPLHVYEEALRLGIETMANKFEGHSKLTKKDAPNDVEREASALAGAQAKIDDLAKGNLGKAKKVKGPSNSTIKTEALRLAKLMVKDLMKAQKLKQSDYSAAEITKMAEIVLGNDPSLTEQAKANVEARTAVKAPELNLKEFMQVNPELVAKAEKRKADQAAAKKSKAGTLAGTLSAAQAGKVAPRKPQATAH